MNNLKDITFSPEVNELFLKYLNEYNSIMNAYNPDEDFITKTLAFEKCRSKLYNKFGLEILYYNNPDEYCYDCMLKNETNYKFININDVLYLELK